MKYKIYHIPGVKIGVSMRLRERLRDQGYTLKDAEIIEEHDDIELASVREKQLQIEYGYGHDTNGTYSACVSNSRKGNRHEISKKGWKNRDRETAIANSTNKLREAYKNNPELITRGEKNGFARLKTDDVIKIRELALRGYTHQKIADMFNISQAHCTNIIIGKRWGHI